MATKQGTLSVISADSLLKPLAERKKAVRRQKFMVFLANLGIFVLGTVTCLPSVTLDELTNTKNPVHLSETQSSWFASINFMTCPVGGLLTACMLDQAGRKNTLVVTNIFAIISWTLMATAGQDDSQSVFIQLLASRFISGICNGLSGPPVRVYGAEISFPKFRGRLILANSFVRALGTTFAYTLGYLIREDYHRIATIMLCMQIGSLFALIPLIESPSWLLLRGRDVEAKKSLSYFRGLNEDEVHQELEAEFDQLQKAVNRDSGEKKPSFLKALLLPEVYKPLLIMLGLFMCQQITGSVIMTVYAVDLVIIAGIKMDPFLCAIILSTAGAITTLLMMWLFELWGRRLSIIVSISGMTIALFSLAATDWLTWLDIPFFRIVAMLLYVIANAMGMLILPFFMIAEVFPQKFRGPCVGITSTIGFLMMFLGVKTYPTMKEEMGSTNIFVLFGVMSVLSIVFVYIFLPETRGKTLLEIEEYFRGTN